MEPYPRNPDQKPRRIFAASDLHLGAVYAHSKLSTAIVEKGIRDCDTAVLCGDIFEGTQKIIWSLKTRIAMGKEALKRWSDANPQAHIHLIFGNHEEPLIDTGTPEKASYLEVGQALKAYAATLPNVTFEDKGWVQMGDIVFTHGHREMGFTEKTPKFFKQLLHIIPNIVLPGKLAAKRIFPTRETVEKIHASFSKEHFSGPVNHVVYGHTHTPMQDYTLEDLKLGGSDKDVKFHNLGASIRGRADIFQPLLLEQGTDGITQRITRVDTARGANR